MTKKPDPMHVEARQLKLAQNAEAIDRWQRRLFRAARELDKLVKQRKRLLGPKTPAAVRYRFDRERGPLYGGGDFKEDDIPL
jgi:hypothetical protein